MCDHYYSARFIIKEPTEHTFDQVGNAARPPANQKSQQKK